MTLEEMRARREKERYLRLRSENPRLYACAVQIGSLVTTAIDDTDPLKLAAQVESAAITLALDALDAALAAQEKT